MTSCTIVMNTKNGYCMRPIKCRSIAEAVRTAREYGLAYRIFVNGVVVKSGWIVER